MHDATYKDSKMLYFLGGGKSRCDTSAAIAKNGVTKALNKGMDADTPKNFAKCIADAEIANMIVTCGEILNKEPMPTPRQIPEISTFRHFQFENTGIQLKKVSGVGEGKRLSMKPISTTCTYKYEIMNPQHLENFVTKKKSLVPAIKPGKVEKVQKPAFEDEDSEPFAAATGAFFKCQKSALCEAKFLKYKNLEKHMMGDLCIRYSKKRTESMIDMGTRIYLEEFGSSCLSAARERGDESDKLLRLTDLPKPDLNESFAKFYSDLPSQAESLQPGFALPAKKGHYKMNKKQLQYLKKQFQRGLDPGQRTPNRSR